MENTPPRRGNRNIYADNADNSRKKRKREKESKRNENTNPQVSRRLVFDKIEQLENTVKRLQEIQNEDKNNLLDQIKQLKSQLQGLKWYIDVQLGTVELHSKPNDLKY